MSDFKGLSVILPTVNETTSLEKTVDLILQYCRHEDLSEIILATADFATSACRTACEKIKKHNKSAVPIRIYVQSGPFEDAIRDLTAMISGSHFIYQPTDLEEDPRLLAEVIRLSKHFPNAIISGSRLRSNLGFSGFSPGRRMLYGAWRILVSVFYGRGVTDPTLLYRCMPSEPAKKIILTAKSYAVLFEMFLKLLRIRIPVIEFPVEMGKRTEGKSSTKVLSDGLRYARVFFSARFTPVDRFLRTDSEKPRKDGEI